MTIKLNGSVGGSVSLDAPPSTTSQYDINFKLPVADGSADQILKTDGSGNLGFVTPYTGIKMLDVWYMTNAQSISADTETGLTDNFVRSEYSAKFGGQMTKASGSANMYFPSTGIYEIFFNISIASQNGSNTQHAGAKLYVDSGSGFGGGPRIYPATTAVGATGGGWSYLQLSGVHYMDVTNTSTNRVYFSCIHDHAAQINGDSSNDGSLYTYAVFKKIAET